MSTPALAILKSVDFGADHGSLFVDPCGEEAIRGELYGSDRLEACLGHLANASRLKPAPAHVRPLLDRFEENCRLLTDAHSRIAAAIERREHFGTDAEWLLDNFHIVKEALSEIQNDLPHGYHSQLPKLANSSLAGYPRIYSLALSLCAHTDSCFDEAKITRCVQAYQSVAP